MLVFCKINKAKQISFYNSWFMFNPAYVAVSLSLLLLLCTLFEGQTCIPEHVVESCWGIVTNQLDNTSQEHIPALHALNSLFCHGKHNLISYICHKCHVSVKQLWEIVECVYGIGGCSTSMQGFHVSLWMWIFPVLYWLSLLSIHVHMHWKKWLLWSFAWDDLYTDFILGMSGCTTGRIT